MATTLTDNLRLRVSDDLTADARYNLFRLDLLGGSFQTTLDDDVLIRSRTNIQLQPNNAAIGGSGSGGTITFGDAGQSLTSFLVYSNSAQINDVDITDVSSEQTLTNKTLTLPNVNEAVNLTATSTELNQLDGTTIGGNTSGDVATIDDAQTLTNKTINANNNTISNIANDEIAVGAGIVYSKLDIADSIVNADVNSSAGIVYSKLDLSDSIVNADIATSAAIAGTKISPDFGLQNIETSGELRLSNGSNFTALAVGSSPADVVFTLPNADGAANQVVRTDGSGNLSFVDLPTGLSLLENQINVGDANDETAQIDTSSVGDILIDSVTGATLKAGIIDNADINASAAIEYSKLDLTDSVVNADIASAAAIAFSKMEDLTTDRALVSDVSGDVSVSAVTATELGHVSGVTSSIQDQLDDKQATLTGATTGLVSTNLDANIVPVSDASGKIINSAITTVELNHLDGVTSNIQTQLNDKIESLADVDAEVVTEDWLVADGATKTITHNLTNSDIDVTIYDENGITIFVDSEERTDSNTLTLTSSQVPTGTWRVLIKERS